MNRPLTFDIRIIECECRPSFVDYDNPTEEELEYWEETGQYMNYLRVYVVDKTPESPTHCACHSPLFRRDGAAGITRKEAAEQAVRHMADLLINRITKHHE